VVSKFNIIFESLNVCVCFYVSVQGFKIVFCVIMSIERSQFGIQVCFGGEINRMWQEEAGTASSKDLAQTNN
jgi:hypothetical protein